MNLRARIKELVPNIGEYELDLLVLAFFNTFDAGSDAYEGFGSLYSGQTLDEVFWVNEDNNVAEGDIVNVFFPRVEGDIFQQPEDYEQYRVISVTELGAAVLERETHLLGPIPKYLFRGRIERYGETIWTLNLMEPPL